MFDSDKDREAEQLIRDYRRVITFLEENRARIEAQGIDVSGKLAQARSELAELEKVCSATEDAQEKFLQASADLADKEFEVFRETSKMVDQLLETHPDDPRVQEIYRRREELKKQFPKDKH